MPTTTRRPIRRRFLDVPMAGRMQDAGVPFIRRDRSPRGRAYGAGMEETVTCPYCGEPIEVNVDEGVAGRQAYVEDCWVCCRPIAITVVGGLDDEGGEAYVEARRMDE
jgi:hypothetical protein